MPETLDYVTIAVLLAVLGLQWNLHRDLSSVRSDLADVRERLARLEGAVDILTKFLIDRERQA